MHTEQSERVRLAEMLGSAPRDVYPLRAKVVETSFPIPEPPEDMPTKDEILARNQFLEWSMRGDAA